MAIPGNYVEGRDYDFVKGGKILRVRSGDWKVEAEDSMVRFSHGGMQMLQFDINGFNNFLNLVLRFADIARFLRERGGKESDAPEAVKR